MIDQHWLPWITSAFLLLSQIVFLLIDISKEATNISRQRLWQIVVDFTNFWLIDLLFLRPAQEYFTFKIDYLRFYVPLKKFSLIWRRHHCRLLRQRLYSHNRYRTKEATSLRPHLWPIVTYITNRNRTYRASLTNRNRSDLSYSAKEARGNVSGPTSLRQRLWQIAIHIKS
jgi:hypothetical protein